MKRIIIKLCILLLAFSMFSVCAFAAKDEQTKAADMLYELGLFKGTNDGYALDKTLTRAEAVTMIVRFWGAEEQAIKEKNEHPFTDVPEWADPYIGYAYANAITYGVSETEFLPDSQMNEKQFYTLLLRLLGYDDLAGDFRWDASESLAGQVGLLRGLPENVSPFLRGTMVRVCKNALSSKAKDSSKTLAQILMDKDVFTEAEYKKAQNPGTTSGGNKVSGGSSNSGSSTTKPVEPVKPREWTTTVTNETPDLAAQNVFILAGEAKDSKTLEITLSLDGVVELCGFDFRLKYDAERYALASINTEYDLSVVSDAESVSGEIAFNYATVNNIKKPKQILTATFTVLGKEGTDTIELVPVEVTRVAENYDVVTAPHSSTTVTVEVK